MNTQIQIFNNPQLGKIRTAKSENGEPIFCLADVCKILDIGNTSQIKTRLNPDGVTTNEVIDSMHRLQPAIFITESNLYKVIFQSRKPEAEAFTEWVTSEVLPSIRKNGGYIHAKPEDTPEVIMAKALLLADSTIKAQEAKLQLNEKKIELLEEVTKEQAPKVLFADSVAASDKTILIGELAKIICQNGYQIGQNRLFSILRQKGYLGVKGDYYNLPTQMAMNLGLFEIKKTSIDKPDGTILVTSTTKVTGKGQIYFVNKFLAKVTQEA